ncbi:hypothetical protein CIG19_18780 [Enterobacterales bacterium CwR94]|nr:hypothetical protein CIG19_18780 [Enterobacterales bacterium CwR94]
MKTKKEYAQMTDHQINELVAITRGTVLHSENGKAIYAVEGLDLCTDFCNSWADAGPVIQAHGISLYHDNGEWEAEATLNARLAVGSDEGVAVFASQKKPLRAAMIAFLMSQEKKEAEK